MLKLKIRLLLAALCAVLLLPQTALAGDWITFGGDQERKHYSSENFGPPIAPKWALHTGASRSQPILVGNRIYHLAGDYLWALDAAAPFGADESQLVKDKVKISEAPSASHPTWAGNGVYFGTGNQPDGKCKLGYYESGIGLGSTVPLSAEVVSAPLVLAGDTVVAATTDGYLHIVRGLGSGYDKQHLEYRASSGRISSSAAPIGPDSFAIGMDSSSRVNAYRIVTAGGSLSLELLWSLQTESGVPASFAVDGDSLYFSDKGAGFYRVNKYSGEVIWHNTDLYDSSLNTFINNSPAVAAGNVYFTLRNYRGGNGRLVGLGKDTGAVNITAGLPGQGNTAPLVWAKTSAVLAGDMEGHLSAFKGADGKPFDIAYLWDGSSLALTNSLKLSDFSNPPTGWNQLSGVSTELTMASGDTGSGLLLAGSMIGDSDGYLIAFAMEQPNNLKAVSLDLGVPEGLKAEPDAEYTATVIFANESDQAFAEVPVAVKHGQYFALLMDENGQYLPQRVVNNQAVQVADFGKKGTPGAQRAFTCVWHPFMQCRDGLLGCINCDETGKKYPEISYDDNKIYRETEVNATADISVAVLTTNKNPYVINGMFDNAAAYPDVNIRVTRKDDGADPLPFILTIYGPGGVVTKAGELNPGDKYIHPYGFTAREGGTWTISAEAWPVGVEDAYPADNTDSADVSVIKKEFIKVEPVGPGIHVELGGGGPPPDDWEPPYDW